MKLLKQKPDALHIHATENFFELSVPQSKVTLKVPTHGLAVEWERDGDGATTNPRYFHFKGIDSGLVVSRLI